jgi:hypothetical protein
MGKRFSKSLINVKAGLCVALREESVESANRTALVIPLRTSTFVGKRALSEKRQQKDHDAALTAIDDITRKRYLVAEG